MKELSKTDEKKGGNDDKLSIIIQTPQGDWEATFSKTTKVSEVIQAVIDHFGFASNGKYELRLANDPNTALKPERPLVSYGVKEGDALVFIDFGQAV